MHEQMTGWLWRNWRTLQRASRAMSLVSAFVLATGWTTRPAAAVGTIDPGPLAWTEPTAGLEVAELSVMEAGAEVERVHLARIDPRRFKFEVLTAPDAARDLNDWMTVSGAVLIINGSYFDRNGKPATPVVSHSHAMGPVRYGTKHGAFVVTASGPAVLDLRHTRWQQAFHGASEAMVSFPMLIDADGQSRAGNSNPDLLANRSFIGQDGRGRILVGTTQEAYFSLDRFADFLAGAGLELTRALNLDGGPPACQAIAVGTFRRTVCASADDTSDSARLRILSQLFGQRPWGLPIVLAVFPK